MDQDFCQRCGSAIDPKTGRCPDCSQRGSRAVGIFIAVAVLVLILAVSLLRGPIEQGTAALAHLATSIFEEEAEPPALARDEAVKAAQDYWETDFFTPNELSLQLSKDGFEKADIDYALEHCGADWYESAAYFAIDWVAEYYCCRTTLVETLLDYGFTEDEAQYGADFCGANWSEEALFYGEYLLSEDPSLTAEAMTELLLGFGYSDEEVEYAVSALFPTDGTL